MEVLLAHRTLTAHHLTEAIDRTVAADILNPDLVLIDARRAATQHVAAVVPIAGLDRYDRPTPSLHGYDELLTRTAALP